MADIFEEVEDSLRQDKLTVAWKKYGFFAYLAAALLIGGVALSQYLQSQAKEKITADTIVLEAALSDLDASEYQASGDALAELTASDARLAPIAAHYLAKVRLDGNGDALAAADVLTVAAASSEGPAAKLALLKSAYLMADTMTRTELEAKLSDLRRDEAAFTAFDALALELIAAKALEEGDVEFARTEFNYLRLAPNVPSGVATRASRALATLPPLSADELNVVDPLETEPEAEPAPAEETGE